MATPRINQHRQADAATQPILIRARRAAKRGPRALKVRRSSRPGSPTVGLDPLAVAWEALWALRRLEPTAVRLMLLHSAVTTAVIGWAAEGEARRKGIADAPLIRRDLRRMARSVTRTLKLAGARP